MRRQAVSTTALVLALTMGLAAPARAGTITFADVMRSVGASGQYRPASEVRLRLGAQSGTAAPAATNGAAQTGGAQDQTTGGTVASGESSTQSGTTTTTGTTTGTTADPTISQSGGVQVQTVDIGDVTGTVCDCGELIPAAPEARRGFPWWVLAGVPLICVSGICSGDDDNPPPPDNPPPTPPPPDTPVPEPLSLLLFGSGLLAVGARARRRGRKHDSSEEIRRDATTGEV